jgi:N-ethylmaleimide reductase
VARVWGPEHVGVPLSPTSPFNSMGDSDPETTFAAAAGVLAALGLAWVN